MDKVKRLLHDKLGWGYPSSSKGGDSFQPIFGCRFCEHELAKDSTGSWFHL